MALFLLGGLIAAGAGFFGVSPARTEGVQGGPALNPSKIEGETDFSTAYPASLAAASSMPEEEMQTASQEGTTDALSAAEAAFAARPGILAGNMPANLLIYTVRKGDTLSGIAAEFGVSTESILAENPGIQARSLRLGAQISIAVTGGDPKKLVSSSPAPTASSAPRAAPEAKLPDLKGYFVKPAGGFNWGQLHKHNAVDIANTCGTPVIAAADGVVMAAADGGWNGGYGSYVLLEHPNGVKTRYAHLQTVAAAVGDLVGQGQGLGTMGRTGESTGCHLHFEVDGARNPFAK